MQKHVRVYLNHFDIGETDIWQCEACTKQDHIVNLEIHHIHGRGPGKDIISNLACLCKKCHSRAHGAKNYVNKDQFQLIHNYFLSGKRSVFLK